MRRTSATPLRTLFYASIVCIPSQILAATLDEQRSAFREAYPAAERGDWTIAASRADTLQDYVLWPDLKAAYLRRQIGRSDAEIQTFLNRYRTLKPARELRYRYALSLARTSRYADYLALYSANYSDLREASLDCLAAQARIELGHVTEAAEQARTLWLVGKNQVKQCDPVFAYLRGNGALTTDLYRQRYDLTVEKQEFMLSRYLARSIDNQTLAEANRWLRAQGDADRFLRVADIANGEPIFHRQLAYAARRLAFSDPDKALQHWRRLDKDMSFDPSLGHEVTRHAALWAARLNSASAESQLDTLADDAVDNEVRRWRIRVALRNQNWAHVIDVITSFDPSERAREEWQYWRAIALEASGAAAESMLIMSGLAEERSYYGFLAADHLGTEYGFAESTVVADEDMIRDISRRPDIVRARELFIVGLDGRGRSEWDAAMRLLSDDEKPQAALLAHRWNWHSRAIAVAAQAGEYDALDLRYPLPHREAFQQSSSEAGVRESWAYGVARSESLFMRDIRSSAGAVGVMQLMPSTGRSTATEIKHPYKGRNTLIDPASNIRLGTRYLGKMNDRFDQHPALATAAYNAGPQRVSRWLPGAGPMDARIWVETIPFNETRSYVRRVLTSDVIFHWRMTGQTRRISNHLPEINP